MLYLSTASPAGCSQERVMDVGVGKIEVKLVGVDGTGITGSGEVGIAVSAKKSLTSTCSRYVHVHNIV